MSEQEKKWQRIYDLLHTETKLKKKKSFKITSFFVYCIQCKKKFLEKGLFKEKIGVKDWTKNLKKVF